MNDHAHPHAVHADMLDLPVLPDGAIGIDAGLTLTKVVHATATGVVLDARETRSVFTDRGWTALREAAQSNGHVGVTGAKIAVVPNPAGHVQVDEIEASARGIRALLAATNRTGDGEYLMAMLGTGTAFAIIRGDDVVEHLGGTPLGGGSFAGIAHRVDPSLSYEDMIARAERGERRNVDTMVSDLYPDGIGRISADMTAAHLAQRGQGSLDDFLAGLLNMHAENVAQIAASRARMADLKRVVVGGGFVHNNPTMLDMFVKIAGLFGIAVEAVPAPGYAPAIGAALIAAESPGAS
jgi:type II pantothenate kinase